MLLTQRLITAIMGLILLLAIASATELSEISWKETFDVSYGTEPYAYSGTASVRENALRLTDMKRGQKGRLSCKQSFDLTEFTARFRFKIVGSSGADGLLFSWSPEDKTKFEAGKGLGWGPNVKIGYGFEVDTYQNLDYNDPPSPHFALISRGVNHHVSNAAAPNIRDGRWHEVLIEKKGDFCNVSIDGVKTLSANLPSDYSRGYFRFSASTGTVAGEHWIDDIDIQVRPPQETTAKNKEDIRQVSELVDSEIGSTDATASDTITSSTTSFSDNKAQIQRMKQEQIKGAPDSSSYRHSSESETGNIEKKSELTEKPRSFVDSIVGSLPNITREQVVPTLSATDTQNSDSKNARGFTMKTFFYILANIMVVLSLVGQFLLIIKLVLSAGRSAEVILRCMSVTGGLFVFFAAQSLGITIADLLSSAIGQNALTISILGVVIPVAVGITITKYFISSMKKDDDVAMRIFIFFGTLIIVMFGDAYATSTEDKTRLLPNISFVLSIIMYAILRYKTK